MEDEDLETDSLKPMSLYIPWKVFVYIQRVYVSPFPHDLSSGLNHSPMTLIVNN